MESLNKRRTNIKRLNESIKKTEKKIKKNIIKEYGLFFKSRYELQLTGIKAYYSLKKLGYKEDK